MSVRKLLSHLAPYECLGCGIEGALVCLRCAQELAHVPGRCYRCYRLSANSRTCPSCRSSSALYAVWTHTIYTKLAKELVWHLKFSGAQAAAQEMGRLFTQIIPDDAVFVPVPTASSRARQRGYDQAILLARALSRCYRLPHITALRRLGQQHQVGASREQRVTQMADAYRCTKPRRIAGRHVVLVDDVLTTGATLEAAAKVIKAAGAIRVSAVVFAQA